MESLGVIGIIFLAFVAFVIYFIFKILQFVIMAINLYKKMVYRQDAMIKLLIDIRDNTKTYDHQRSDPEVRDSIEKYQRIIAKNEFKNNSSVNTNEDYTCEMCKAVVDADAKTCPSCGAKFE